MTQDLNTVPGKHCCWFFTLRACANWVSLEIVDVDLLARFARVAPFIVLVVELVGYVGCDFELQGHQVVQMLSRVMAHNGRGTGLLFLCHCTTDTISLPISASVVP